MVFQINGIGFDWYKKDTRDWLVNAPGLATAGAPPAPINGGSITNKGVELSINWNDQIGNVKYGISGNMSSNKNKVTSIDNQDGIIHGKSNVISQNTTEMYRAEVGYAIGYKLRLAKL